MSAITYSSIYDPGRDHVHSTSSNTFLIWRQHAPLIAPWLPPIGKPHRIPLLFRLSLEHLVPEGYFFYSLNLSLNPLLCSNSLCSVPRNCMSCQARLNINRRARPDRCDAVTGQRQGDGVARADCLEFLPPISMYRAIKITLYTIRFIENNTPRRGQRTYRQGAAQ